MFNLIRKEMQIKYDIYFNFYQQRFLKNIMFIRVVETNLFFNIANGKVNQSGLGGGEAIQKYPWIQKVYFKKIIQTN